MPVLPFVLLVPVSFLVGRIPSALVVAGRHGRDPLAEGSGNPGATNVARVAGRRAGVVVLVADMAKGFVCAVVGSAVGGDGLGMACGMAAVVGHVAPLTRRGGKGVATAAGVALALQPGAAFIAGVAFAATLAATRVTALASIAAAIALTAAVVAVGAPTWEILAFGALAGLVIGRHAENLRRLRAGTEHRAP